MPRRILVSLPFLLVPLLVAGFLLLVPGAHAAESAAEISSRTIAELRLVDPEAAGAFSRAEDALRRRDLAEASRLYAEVASRVPDCDVAIRRRSWVESALSHAGEAEKLGREAVALRRSAPNLTNLATVLSENATGWPAGGAQRAESDALAEEASGVDPTDVLPLLVMAQTAMSGNDRVRAESKLMEALAMAPEDPEARFANAIFLANEGRLRDAESELERARERGLDSERYASLSGFIEQQRPRWSRPARIVLTALIAWASAFVLLLVAGMTLSAATLRIARRRAEPGRAHHVPAGMRRAYTAVIWASCAFYYLSLPLVLIAVLAVGGALVLLMVKGGVAAIKLVLLAAAMILVTCWAVLKSLLVRGRDEDPGERLDLKQHPRLEGQLAEVAARIGTEPVDDVFLTAGTSIAVFERGGLWARAGKRTRRCLILGAGALEGMRLPAFRAILGHEYGHLINRDCAGGGLALAVRRSIGGMAMGLAEGGAATWYNPAWWFVKSYFRVFLRISHGASRLQEVMADRWAVSAYGSDAFIEGLTHVIRRAVRLEGQAQAAMQLSAMTRVPVANVYRFTGAGVPTDADVEQAVGRHLAEPASPFDSHPRPADRFLLAADMAVPVPVTPEDSDDAWSLLDDREGIERRMSAASMAQVSG